jgi:hypothetical protein
MCEMAKDEKILVFLDLFLESQNHREKLLGLGIFCIFGLSDEGFIQHFFFYSFSDSTVSEDAGNEPRTVVSFALAL